VATNQYPDPSWDIDLREEVADILDNHGHRGYLRKISDQRCSCYKRNPYNEADPDCPTCVGIGYGYLDYLILMYRIPAVGAFRGTQSEQLSPIGLLGPDDAQFYLKTTTGPRQSDYILEMDTDDDQNIVQAPRIERVWDVGQVVPYRDRKGRVEYYACRCKRLDAVK